MQSNWKIKYALRHIVYSTNYKQVSVNSTHTLSTLLLSAHLFVKNIGIVFSIFIIINFFIHKSCERFSFDNLMLVLRITVWKVSVFGVFLVLISRSRNECEKIRTRKTPKTDTFHTANVVINPVLEWFLCPWYDLRFLSIII